jgi:hypothetical protein
MALLQEEARWVPAGPVVAGAMLFVGSGYLGGGTPGTVFLAFGVNWLVF